MPATRSALSAEEAAHARVSIRRYAPDPITREELEALLAATTQSPSAYNLQPWRFVVVLDTDLKARLAEAAYRQPQVTGAPAIIVLYTDMQDVLAHLDDIAHPGMDPEQRERLKATAQRAYGGLAPEAREAFGATQGGIALGYLLLTAASMGFGTSPMLGFEPDKVKAVLDLPEHVRIPALIAIGRPGENGRPRHRHALQRIVTFR